MSLLTGVALRRWSVAWKQFSVRRDRTPVRLTHQRRLRLEGLERRELLSVSPLGDRLLVQFRPGASEQIKAEAFQVATAAIAERLQPA